MLGSELTQLGVETLYLVLLVSGPVLIVSLAVGLTTGLLQAVTQVQEQTLGFVPKLAAVAVCLAVSSGWMAGHLVRFTTTLWTSIPTLVP
jgi:flagellar biosynthetic protein FliQ